MFIYRFHFILIVALSLLLGFYAGAWRVIRKVSAARSRKDDSTTEREEGFSDILGPVSRVGSGIPHMPQDGYPSVALDDEDGLTPEEIQAEHEDLYIPYPDISNQQIRL